MQINRNKKLAFIVFFCLYFLAYTVSPVAFTLSGSTACRLGAGSSPSGIEEVHVLAFDLITHHTLSSPVSAKTILLKKKRAIVPEMRSLKFSPLSVAVTLDVNPFPVLPGVVAHRAETEPLHGSPGFQPIFAGHSPPFC